MSTHHIEIQTAQGMATAGLFQPPNPAAKASGVILYMDAFGPRAALDAMARRLAAAGHVVLVPDLFYRFGAYGPFDAKTALDNPATKSIIMGMVSGTPLDMTNSDSGAFIAALTEHGATGPIGTVGYCMGGARAITAASKYPDRIKAAASFHGGRLANGLEDSPAAVAANVKARVYVGCAGVDSSFPPEQSALLARAFREAGVDHIIENYVGMQHGWCVTDHKVFDETGAERHWKRLLTLFEETLG